MLEQPLLFCHNTAVLRELGAGLTVVQHLLLAERILGEMREVLGDPRRQLCPCGRVPTITQHQSACLKRHESRHRFAGGRRDGQRGNRADRDLPIHGHETAHRTQAQGTDAGEHEDHER